MNSFEGGEFAFLMQARYDLAYLAVRFFDPSLLALSGTLLKMGNNGRALLRAKSDELLAGQADPLAYLLQRYGRNADAEFVELLP